MGNLFSSSKSIPRKEFVGTWTNGDGASMIIQPNGYFSYSKKVIYFTTAIILICLNTVRI